MGADRHRHTPLRNHGVHVFFFLITAGSITTEQLFELYIELNT